MEIEATSDAAGIVMLYGTKKKNFRIHENEDPFFSFSFPIFWLYYVQWFICTGHLDKQPPFEGWFEGFGPYTPVYREGMLTCMYNVVKIISSPYIIETLLLCLIIIRKIIRSRSCRWWLCGLCRCHRHQSFATSRSEAWVF